MTTNQRKIKFLRKKLDKITEELIELIAKRKNIVLEIGNIKKEEKMSIVDSQREKEEIEKAKILAKKFKLNQTTIEKITKILIQYGRELQKK